MNKRDKAYICTEILSICLIIFCLVILFLSEYICKREPVCERIHLDEIDKSKNVISSGEMAKRIVEIYEKYCEKYKNYEAEEISDTIEVIYDEQQYEWIV